MQTYHISNEAKGTSKSFTSKRLARKQMAQQNRDGERYNCYIYWGDPEHYKHRESMAIISAFNAIQTARS